MADFDAAFDLQRAFAVRARIAFHHVADIGHDRLRQIAFPVNPDIVFAVDVGAGAEVAHLVDAAIGDNRHRQTHRAKRAWTSAYCGADLFFGGERQRRGDDVELLRFNLVQLVIAAHQQRNQRMAALFAGFYHQRLHGFLNRQLELLDQLGDGFRVRRVDLRQRLSRLRAIASRRYRFRHFDIGGVVRIG